MLLQKVGKPIPIEVSLLLHHFVSGAHFNPGGHL